MADDVSSAMTSPGSGKAVILVTGVMAAGKSTIAQRLAESFPRAAHIRGDVFRRFVVSGRVEPTPSMPPTALDQMLLRYRLATATATADAYAEAGFVAVVQDIIVGPVLTEVIEMVATQSLFVIVLDPDASAVAGREAGRRKTGYIDGWSPASLVTDFRSSTPRVGLWLDTTDLDEHQTVRAVLDHLDEARIRR